MYRLLKGDNSYKQWTQGYRISDWAEKLSLTGAASLNLSKIQQALPSSWVISTNKRSKPLKEGINNIANKKERSCGQNGRRWERIAIAVFENLLA